MTKKKELIHVFLHTPGQFDKGEDRLGFVYKKERRKEYAFFRKKHFLVCRMDRAGIAGMATIHVNLATWDDMNMLQHELRHANAGNANT